MPAKRDTRSRPQGAAKKVAPPDNTTWKPGTIAVIGKDTTIYCKPPVPPYNESLDCDECGTRFEVCMLLDTDEGYAECPHCHTDLQIQRVSYLVSMKGQR
jgi:predicted nucleic acid-binding Zn ribbon protein